VAPPTPRPRGAEGFISPDSCAFMGLRYTGLRVTNLERSLHFYTDLMGLREVGRRRTRSGSVWVLLQDPRTRQRLELNWYPRSSPFAGPYQPGDGLDHVGFHVSDPGRWVRKLIEQGARPALLPSDPNGVRGVYYLLDPDGNWVEIF
jgi:catechol 2,3-dioxygenase-like lactoylglutathione lyase family enzyme